MTSSSSDSGRAAAPTRSEVIRAVSLASVERLAAEWVAAHPEARVVRQTVPFAVGDHPNLIENGAWEIRIDYHGDDRRPAALFHRAALALFGERYRSPLAQALRLKRIDTIDDWCTGRSDVPKGVWLDMTALLAGRRSEVPELLDEMRLQANVGSDNAFYSAETINELLQKSSEAEGKYTAPVPLPRIKFARLDRTSDYASQENDARRMRCGLWEGTFEMPWDWRQSNTRANTAPK